MRIIAGKYRGKKLQTPEGQNTRPTSDRLRESIFNILTHKLEGGFYSKRVADLFAGTGAMGLEALSRGADLVWLIEKHEQTLHVLKANANSVDPVKAIVKVADARNLPRTTTPFDIIFIDPPYNRDLISPALISAKASGWINDKTLIIIEMAKDDSSSIPEEYVLIDERTQGKTKVLFLNAG